MSLEHSAIEEIDRLMGSHAALTTEMAIKMHMQIALAKAHGEDIERFIAEHHNDSFRDFFEAHPEFVERYKYEPELVLHEIGEYVYRAA